jgi:hypothetical protein
MCRQKLRKEVPVAGGPALSCLPSSEPSFVRGSKAKSPSRPCLSHFRNPCFARQRDRDSSACRSLTDASVDGCRTDPRLLQTVRSTGNADDNRTTLCAPSTHHLRVGGCRFHFRFSPNSGTIKDGAVLRICAHKSTFIALLPVSASNTPQCGGVYGSGVPMAINGCFFTLASNSPTIFNTGPNTQLSVITLS